MLDEADEMLRMGFIDDVEWILEHTPDEHQVALFSATMPTAIKKITKNYLKNPIEVKVESATQTVDRIDQTYIEVNNARKLAALDLLLETEQPDATMVFARTKIAAQELAQKLESRGYRSAAIHGDLNQRQRETCIRQLKDSVIDVLVATDVAARGIDVPRITHVVNYDIPYDGESYIHRIGRTGRAGRSGKAILFVNQRERRILKTIERTTGQAVARFTLPTAEALREIRAEQFVSRIRKTLDKGSHDELREQLIRVQQENGFSLEDMALALAVQAQSSRSLVVKESDISMIGGKNNPLGKGREKRGERRDGGDGQGRRNRSSRSSETDNIQMDKYQLAVGSSHGVRVGDVLGAVANELGIESQYIGEIDLQEESSSIELPEGMPKELFNQFKKIRIRNYPAQPELVGGKPASGDKKKRSSASKKSKPARGKADSRADSRSGRKSEHKSDRRKKGSKDNASRGKRASDPQAKRKGKPRSK